MCSGLRLGNGWKRKSWDNMTCKAGRIGIASQGGWQIESKEMNQATEQDITECTNCAEVNTTDNELCKACRMVEPWQVQEWLSESLIEANGWIRIGSLTYEPIRVLKSVDPIAYNEMYLDFCDSLARDGYIVRNYNDNE